MKIALCDDSRIDIEIITEFLKIYFSDKMLNCLTEAYDSGDELLKAVKEGTLFDVVFLDIYMEPILGIDVARELRKNKYEGAIIFLTATDEYAVDSYDVMALGYLLKPHSYDKFCKVMDRFLETYKEDTYQIKRRGGVISVPLSEIMYIESSNSKCILHRKDTEVYTIYKKLDEIEAELNDPSFLRCHQSYIVNMSYVESAEDQFVLTNGDIVYIRHRDIKSIRQKYFDYIDLK